VSLTPPRPPFESWEVLDLLTSLVEKSLVVYEEDEQGNGRYRLLETVRQYSRDRLLESGEGEVVRGRHLDLFLALAAEAEPQFEGPEQAVWLDRLEREHDNLRAALEWCHAGAVDPKLGLQLAAALHWFWDTHSHLTEGRQHLAWVSSLRPERTAERERVLHAAGALALRQSDYAAAHALGEESLAIARERGNRNGVARSLGLLGAVFQEMGEFQKARLLLEENLAICREVGGSAAEAAALNNLGLTAVYQKRFAEATAWLEESLAVDRELGDRAGISMTLNNLGMVALGQQEGDYAHSLFTQSLRIKRELGMRMDCAWGLEGLGGVAAARGQPDRAVRLFGAADAVREVMGHPANAPVRELYAPHQAAARAQLGEAAFAAAWAEGRAMALDEAVAYALAEEEGCGSHSLRE
jgi:tetratricopeptide (TPR) repeat protein